MNNYITASEACKLLKCSNTTLYRYVREQKIFVKKLSARKFLYDISTLYSENQESNRKNVIYARVSNSKQKDDLSKQIDILTSYVISNGRILSSTYSDIASGMNENRKGFNSLIDDVINGKIDTVYISYKDRLTRFGFSYFQSLFEKYGTKIVVVNNLEANHQEELTQDLISIIHHFSMKMYSSRRKDLKNLLTSLNKDITD